MATNDKATALDLLQGVQQAWKEQDYTMLAEYYSELARTHRHMGLPLSWDLRQFAARVLLLGLKRLQILVVELEAQPDACEACKELAGKQLTVNQALQELPVPCKDCTTDAREDKAGWCRCSYRPVFGNEEYDSA
jgi:hypothetical protein